MSNPEISGINPLSYPVEYFDAQVRFAHKWAEISGEDFAETLRTKTALYRRIIGDANIEGGQQEEWEKLISGVTSDSNPAKVTELLYGTFSRSPHSAYVQSDNSDALGYGYDPDTKTVKIHFTNPERGVKPLSDENIEKRRQEFHTLLKNIRTEHPEAALVMSATWLRSTGRYRSLSPPDISDQESLMSPSMNFGGNSVWGQFIDASGNGNKRVYDQFVESVATATSLDMLVGAFPYKALKATDPIDKYYEFYGLRDNTRVSDPSSVRTGI